MQKGDNLFPQIKKSIKSFLLNEDGKISKETLLTIGSLLGIAAFGLSERVSASHLCQPGDSGYSGGSCGGEGCGGEGGGGGGGGGGEGCGCGCCFIAGTRILMADDSQKNIEKIKVGDTVKSYNERTGSVENKKVFRIDKHIYDGVVKLDFDNGVSNTNTEDHPYYIQGKGWCSYNPKLTLKRYKIKTNSLEVSDSVYYYDNGNLKWVKVSSIIKKVGSVQTYNLGGVEDNHNYFANCVLVHNKFSGIERMDMDSKDFNAPKPPNL